MLLVIRVSLDVLHSRAPERRSNVGLAIGNFLKLFECLESVQWSMNELIRILKVLKVTLPVLNHSKNVRTNCKEFCEASCNAFSVH